MADGRIDVEGDGPVRTEGAPRTAWTLWQDHRAAMLRARDQFDIPLATIAGIICVESVPGKPDWWRRDTTSHRREPSGAQSGGLMQTLVSTARQVNSTYQLFWQLGDDGKTLAALSLQDLFVAERSIMLGTGYLRTLADSDASGVVDCDPMMLCAAYNAGAIYETDRNRWRMRTYGAGRLEKFARFYNDFLAARSIDHG